ncbi:hypothetical protein Tco_0727692 [Tanacetum coccineum]|uniref:Uncharacterized protein n=1 Tax=Tanacetum coccineum TaxID=301880 RepID=A0ABQ4YK30_9ASTR
MLDADLVLINEHIFKQYSFYNALIATIDAPEIYMQQFWYTITYDLIAKADYFTIGDHVFEVNANLFRNALSITPKDSNHPFTLPAPKKEIIKFINQLGCSKIIIGRPQLMIVQHFICFNCCGEWSHASMLTLLNSFGKNSNTKSSLRRMTKFPREPYLRNEEQAVDEVINTEEHPPDDAGLNQDRSSIELEYHLEQRYLAFSEQLDWTNPEGDRCPYDLSKPLPLQGPLGHLTILVEFFFNNDLEYLTNGIKERKYATCVTKTKAARYDLKFIEDMIPNYRSPTKVAYNKDPALGISHWGPKRQLFYRSQNAATSPHEVLSHMQILGVIHNLSGDEIVHLVNALCMFTKSIFIKRRVEDVQLGVDSYQKKLNITKPHTQCEGISVKEPYTIFYKPSRVVYLNRNNQKRLMRVDELYKFSDGTLKDVCDNLHDMLHNFKMGYNDAMPKRKWLEKDQERTAEMLKLIDDLLLERRIMRSLECYVGGRLNETNYRLQMRTT